MHTSGLKQVSIFVFSLYRYLTLALSNLALSLLSFSLPLFFLYLFLDFLTGIKKVSIFVFYIWHSLCAQSNLALSLYISFLIWFYFTLPLPYFLSPYVQERIHFLFLLSYSLPIFLLFEYIFMYRMLHVPAITFFLYYILYFIYFQWYFLCSNIIFLFLQYFFILRIYKAWAGVSGGRPGLACSQEQQLPGNQ